MPVAVTTLRTTFATALVDNAKWQTFAFPPATVLANSVIVSPDDPYLTPNNNSQISISPMANFKIVMTVPLFDNEGNLISWTSKTFIQPHGEREFMLPKSLSILDSFNLSQFLSIKCFPPVIPTPNV